MKSLLFLILILALTQNLALAQSAFSELCNNPTSTQKETLTAIITEINGSTFDEAACTKIENYYITNPSKHNLPRKLNLKETSVKDLSPIQYLTGVGSLDLSGTPVTSLEFLIPLKNLTVLDLSDTQIKDIDSLRHLSNLENLTLHNTQITDLSPLAKLNLKTLALGGNAFNINRESLNKSLESLYINFAPIKDDCALSHLNNLETLSLSQNELRSISCLKSLTRLTTLDIVDNPISDISIVEKFEHLKHISLKNTQINAINALQDLDELQVVFIDSTKIKDASPISGMKLSLFSTLNTPLHWCSPKNAKELSEGVSCTDENGKNKPWWKRLLRI